MSLAQTRPAEAAMPEIVAARRLKGEATGLFAATGEDFVSAAVERLDLGFEGISGDVHSGMTRRSGGREPWYRRGTEMRNERQISIVSSEELAMAALDMNIDRIRPEWVGANLDVAGIPALSMLPPRTLIFFEGGVTLKVDGQNAPCRLAGRAIADNFPERDHGELTLAFPKAARRRRGLVAWVEKPGTIRPGETMAVHLPEQWIYP